MSEDDYTIRDFGLSMEKVGGSQDGLKFVFSTDQETGMGFWVSESFPGRRYKQVFVPLEMEHPDFV